MDKILFIIWFFLPAGLANSSAVLISKIPVIKNWNYPLDFYLKYKGQRILGSHKTIRGLLTGILVGILVVYAQTTMFLDISSAFEEINYWNLDPLILGGLMGGGALLGDAVKSFFKRRRDFKPGTLWFPFDQIDYILGSSVLTYIYIQLEWYYYVLFLIIGLIAHILTNISAYLLGIKDVPY